MSEVPLYGRVVRNAGVGLAPGVNASLSSLNNLTTLLDLAAPDEGGPRGGGVSYERGTPVNSGRFPPRWTTAPVRSYLTKSVFKVVLQKSIPTQICQRILLIGNSKG